MTVRAEGRVYGGRTHAERRAERRERLLDAGLQEFGTVGWSGTAVERLCLAAGVATRSFYEEFVSREALLLAVYERILTAASAAVAEALAAAPPTLDGRVSAGVSTYIGYLTEDPRRARIVHSEVRAAGALENERRAGFLSFAALVEAESAELFRLGERREGAGRLTALALAGALNELLITWVAEAEPRSSVAPIIDELTALFVAALR